MISLHVVAKKLYYCISVDQLGKPVDIYGKSDYKMQCIGQEGKPQILSNYIRLITFYPTDGYSRYECWVYQRIDQNKIAMTQTE